MKTILHINASARYQDSVSRDLSSKLVEKITTLGDKIIHRDLNNNMQFVSEASLEAVKTPKENRTSQQQTLANLSDILIEELQSANILVLAVPIYNFSAPASFKAWADLVARAGTTFKYTSNGPEGLLHNKKAFVVAVSGGTAIGSDIDFMTPWIRFFLKFLGIHDVEIIAADGIFGTNGREKIQSANQRINSLTLK